MLDELTAEVLRAQLDLVGSRAAVVGVELVADPYVFNDVADGPESWSGHYPSIAVEHDSGRVVETGRALDSAVASLLSPSARAPES